MRIKALPLFCSFALVLSGCGDNGDENEKIMPQNAVLNYSFDISDKTYDNPADNISSGTEDFKSIQAAAEAKRLAVDFSYDSSLIGWGLGKTKDSFKRPLDAVNAQKKYGKYSALFIDLSETAIVYLTFDEGYENGYTASILDTLKEKGVKAVFFVTYDYCKNSPELIRRMIAEGHTVGNHSYSHPSFPKCSEEKMIKEVSLLHDYVKENFGYVMTLFRFPKGEFSEKSLDVIKNMGYTSVFWSFAHKDWDIKSQPGAEEAYNSVISALHSGGIYLLHAVSKANADSLSDMISFWQKNGYTIGDLEKLSQKTENIFG